MSERPPADVHAHPADADTPSVPVEEPPADPFDGPAWDAPRRRSRAASSHDPVPRKRMSRRTRRRRRRVRIALLVAGGLAVLGAAWLVATGLMARSQLIQVRADVHRLRALIAAGDLDAARATAAELARHAHRAHMLTTGPAWAFSAEVPVAGAPLHTVRGITAGVDQLGASALPDLVQASDLLDPSTLRNADGGVDLARIAKAVPGLDRASAVMSTTTRTIAGLPHSTWLPPVDSTRRDILAQLSALRDNVRSADLAARIAPPMLGQDGPKRYFVAFQNDAEARGTGGLPGAFAIVSADRGRLKFLRFESDSALHGVAASVDFGRDYEHLYAGAQTTTLFSNANLSPHFPYAAQIWASMWQQRSGERIDGVIAIDPTALSYLLAVTGPASLPDKTRIGADNVVSFTQSTLYSRFADDKAARRGYLLDVAAAIGNKIIAARADTTSLVRAASRSAGERRLLIWSADAAVQADIAKTSLAGLIPETEAPYVGLSIVNDGGNKLDYYLDRSLTWRRDGCGETRRVTVTITLTNHAPAHGLPDYVTHRSDHHAYPVTPGDNRLEVSYYATDGAMMSSVTVNGKASTAAFGMERGHPVFTVDLELPRGSSRTIVLHLVEPVGEGSPVVLQQPLVRPLRVTVDNARCR